MVNVTKPVALRTVYLRDRSMCHSMDKKKQFTKYFLDTAANVFFLFSLMFKKMKTSLKLYENFSQ